MEDSQVAEITVSYKPKAGKKPVIVTSLDAFNIFRELYSPDTIYLQEQVSVLYLNRSNKVLGHYKASVGGITGTVADIRLILGVALKCTACSLILCHNHPSENIKPSRQDEDLTRKIKEAAKFMDIQVTDHLIITLQEYYSFADEGII
jgi:DNA repair protein RadC